MSFTPETAPPELLIEIFADLLRDPFVFSSDYASELHKLSDNLLEDPNAIAKQLTAWCQARPEILAELENALDRGQSGSIPV